MTREDLLRGNAGVAEELGKNIRQYCPDVKHVVVIFNPADITGLITLIYSGLRPSQVTTLAALDSIRLQSELTKHFKIDQDEVQGCRTYGGHGEAMAVFASGATIQGQPLNELIGTDRLSSEHWEDIKKATVQGGSNIIKLRGRSSFQSPAYVSVKMIEGAMGGEPFTWPAGRYVSFVGMDHIVMAMDTRITAEGAYYDEPMGTDEEMAALKKSYEHLCTMRQEVIDLGILPPIEKWGEINPNLR
jgi:malate dehydrogenase